MKRAKLIAILLCGVSAALLFASLKMPVWQMRLEAPQYKDEEALKVKVYPSALKGDLNELTVLNSYIGVHIPRELPQTHWLPAVLIAGAIAGIFGAFLRPTLRKRTLFIIPTIISLALIFAAAQAQWQMYEIGNKRDEKAKLIGVKDFTTPLIGRAKIAQFTVTSFLGWGAAMIGAALALQWTGAWLSRNAPGSKNEDEEHSPALQGRLAANSPNA